MKNIAILFFIISQISYSQSDSLKRTKISIGVNASIGYSFRNLKQNKNSSDNFIPGIIKLRNGNEVKDVSQTLGITFNYYFKNKLSLGFDFNYNTFNYKTKITYPNITTFDPTIPLKWASYFQYATLEIPIYIGYNYSIKKIDFFANIGIGSHYLIKANTIDQSWYADGSVVTKTFDKTYSNNFNHNRNDFFWSFNSKIGIAYNPIKLLCIKLSPELKYGITAINTETIQTKLFSYGINLSVSLKL